MSAIYHADYFEIINGPEDGTAFPVSRSPAKLGREASCILQPRFDQEIELVHARVSAVSGGYRIRAAGPSPLWVDGKRVGFIRSRIVRDGGIVRVGQTEFIMRTAPEGLASRSIGMPSESDLGWVLRLTGRNVYRLIRAIIRLLLGFGTGLKLLMTVAILLGIASIFHPGVLPWIRNGFAWIRYYFQVGYLQLFGG